MKLKILPYMMFLGLIFSINSKVLAQTITTENGDKVKISVFLSSNDDEEYEKIIDFSSETFTSFPLENDETANIYFNNLTKDTTYTYFVDKLAFNWKVKSLSEDFGHVLLDEEDMTFTFKTGCTLFHIKFYNPRNEEDEENSIWIKIWTEE